MNRTVQRTILLIILSCGLWLGSRQNVTAAQSALPARPEGAALYEQHCASCHRALQRTDLIGGRSLSRIKSSIRVFGVMNGLQTLTDAELEAIAAVLSPPTQSAKNLAVPQE